MKVRMLKKYVTFQGEEYKVVIKRKHDELGYLYYKTIIKNRKRILKHYVFYSCTETNPIEIIKEAFIDYSKELLKEEEHQQVIKAFTEWDGELDKILKINFL